MRADNIRFHFDVGAQQWISNFARVKNPDQTAHPLGFDYATHIVGDDKVIIDGQAPATPKKVYMDPQPALFNHISQISSVTETQPTLGGQSGPDRLIYSMEYTPAFAVTGSIMVDLVSIGEFNGGSIDSLESIIIDLITPGVTSHIIPGKLWSTHVGRAGIKLIRFGIRALVRYVVTAPIIPKFMWNFSLQWNKEQNTQNVVIFNNFVNMTLMDDIYIERSSSTIPQPRASVEQANNNGFHYLPAPPRPDKVKHSWRCLFGKGRKH